MSLTYDHSRIASFAENGNGDAQDRLRKRLTQDRRPSTRASTENWVNWSSMGSVLGQPFDVTKIPISKLEQMQRDPMLAFGLTFIKVPLIRAPWYIKSSDAQRAAFIDNALRRVYGRLILAYSNCFAFGYSGMVKRFEADQPDWLYVDKDNFEAGERPVWEKGVDAIVWKPPLALNPKNAAPHWNAKGEFAGIDLEPPTGVGAFGTSGYPLDELSSNAAGRAADIPLDWALWATNEKDSVYGSYWGYPRLGYAYRYWWSYWYKFGLSDRAFEKWADPPVIVYHPTIENMEDSDGNSIDLSAEALALAEKLRSGANATLPSDVHTSLSEDRIGTTRLWEVEQLKTEANFDALDTTFKYLDVLKLRSMMVPEQALMEGQGGSSSRNVATQFSEIFQESQAVVMEEIDDLINRYMIPQLLEVNFGSGGAKCEKVTTGFNSADVETMRSVIEAIANKHGGVPDIDVRETLAQLGIPLLSWKEREKNLAAIAEQEAAQTQAEVEKLKMTAALKGHKPPTTLAEDGYAGVNEDGYYYDGRERITLSVSPEELKSYLGGLLQKEQADDNTENAKMVETLLSEIEKLDEKVDNLAPQEPPVVNVEVKVPETPVKEEVKPRKTRKTIVRDENGDAKYIDEEEVTDEQA